MISGERIHTLIALLPDAAEHKEADGLRSWRAGRHPFLLLDTAAGMARLWSGDMAIAQALPTRPEVFPVVRAYRFRVVFDVRLARVGAQEFAGLLLDSYAIRCGRRRADSVDVAEFLATARGVSER